MASKFVISLLVLVSALGTSAGAQAKRNSRQPQTSAEPAPTAEPTPGRPKKNERPAGGIDAKPSAGTAKTIKEPLYRYEYSQPDFLINRIVIEHDDTGHGNVSFGKKSYSETITEPIEISPATLDRLRSAFEALNFIDSTENYQFERDFAHMGNVAITLKNAGRERTAKYNWTSNENAKVLMDEYRRVANQYVWMFDFNLARENQPLETPRLVDALDSLLKRNEIADPQQILPFLQAVSNDERVPLIGRNHAGKLVKQIEKQKRSNN